MFESVKKQIMNESKVKLLYVKMLEFSSKYMYRFEDKMVRHFLKKQNTSNENIEYLEVGSGLGNFVSIVKKEFDFNVYAVEINSELADRTSQMGISTFNVNFVDNQFADESFHIVHCSHVIEHIPYPAIVDFLDEMFRITKKGGYVIIRSPLMSYNFFSDIDHIRPYPPKCILNYYSNPQQQRTGGYKIIAEKIKIRRAPFAINSYSYAPVWRSINLFFKILKTLFGLPFAEANGYVAIFKKEDI